MTNCSEPVPYLRLTEFAIVHCYMIFVLGTIGNGVALWCIVTCTRLQPGVKVLLASIFLPLLLLCLVTLPTLAHVLIADLACDTDRFSMTFKIVNMLLYSTLSEMEQVCIAAVSLFRAVAVCNPHRQVVGLRLAVAVVILIIIYCVITSVGMLGLTAFGYLQGRRMRRVLSVLYFLNVLLPILVTIICYGVIMFVVRRNKHRLASSQHSTKTCRAADEATRAMLAVFVTTLILGLPHAIFHLVEEPPHIYDIIFHLLFFTHFTVDPVVFIWFNRSHRQRVGEKMRAGIAWMTRFCSSPAPTTNSDALNLSSTSATGLKTSSDKQGDSEI